MGSNPNLHFLLRCPAPRKPPPREQFSLFGTLVREFPIDVSHLCLLVDESRRDQRGNTEEAA